jgi:hypothetical protein
MGLIAEVTPADVERLLRQAATVLISNWRGHSTVPSGGLYPHQWSWDSAFIGLGLQHLSPRRGAQELLSLLGGQWGDGRIPHIVFNPAVPDEAYFPGPSFWQSSNHTLHPPVATSGIIQPPVHAQAAAALTRHLADDAPSFVQRIYPLLVAQNAYLRERRAVGPHGLAAVVHPWETGLDNSPTWDGPLHAVPADLGLFDIYTRRDLAHAGAGERPTDEDYARYIRLVRPTATTATTTTGSARRASSWWSTRHSTLSGPHPSLRWPNWPNTLAPTRPRTAARVRVSPRR